MATHLIIERADGGVSVMWLAPGSDPAAELARWEAQADPSWLPVARSITATDPVMPDRRWRQAWRRVNQGVGVPLAAARALRKKELLAAVKDRLPRIREKIEQAQDAGTSTAALQARRAALRALDVDTELAAITDLAVLDGYTPTILQTSD